MGMIETLVAKVFATRNAAHLAHLASKSYAEHMALGDFYEGIIGALDAIVEAYQGVHGLIGDVEASMVPSAKSVKPNSVISHLESEVEWIEKHRTAIASDCASIEALVDDLTAVYYKTLYKLKHLK